MADKKFYMIFGADAAFVALLLVVNWMFLQAVPNIFASLNILGIGILVLPIIIVKYAEYKRKKQLEDNFPVFLRDFVETVRGGMTIPQAFTSISKNDYGALSPYIKRISSQLEWGIPVDQVLMSFSKQTKSKLISRVVSSVIESHRFGGKLTDTFEALSQTAVEVDRLRSERRLYLQSQMLTGYIIFFVFLAVIIGLQKFLVPSFNSGFSTNTLTGGASAVTPQQLAAAYQDIFRNLILIQGLFAGLSVGKMAEGSIIAGIKHSLFMMFIGGLIFTIFG